MESTIDYITKVVNLRKVVNEELEAVKELFAAAKRTMNQIQDQISEVGVKLQTTTEHTGGLTITYGEDKITAFDEEKLEKLRKEVRTLRYKIPYNLIYPPIPKFNQQVNVVDDPNVVWHPRTSSTVRSNRMRDKTYQISWMLSDSENSDSKLAECNPNLYFLHHLDAPIHPSTHELNESLNILRDDEWCRRILECLKDFPFQVIIKRSLLFNCLRAHSDSPSLDWKQFDDAMNNIIAKGFLKAICKRSTSSVSSYCTKGISYECIEWAHRGFPNILHFSPLPSEEHEILYSHNQHIIERKKNVKALLLGKWHNSLLLSQHIEVADPSLFYKGMEKLSEIRYISLRGISMIPELPQFITKLKKLQILDCNSCHNLEVIPDNISKLWRTLTHLDVSKCYLLDHIPPALSDLLHLQVLKGFNLGDPAEQQHKSCTLQDLTKLSKLQKLHICTSLEGFPNTDHLIALQKFRSLRNLGISWRALRIHDESTTLVSTLQRTLTQQQFSFDLEKLDLGCVPNTVTRVWLNPIVFRGLKKLYIRGGNFFDLGQSLDEPKEENTQVIANENQWTVEILRLKYLRELKMDKGELHNLFPELTTLEKVDCPNVTSFSCDGQGVWVKPKHLPPTLPL